MAKSRGRGRKKAGKNKQQSALGRLTGGAVSFLFGKPMEDTTTARFQEIKGLCLIAGALWLFLAMISFYSPIDDLQAEGRNWGGQAGFWLANGALMFVGLAAYLGVLLAAAWGVVIVARKQVTFPAMRLFGALAFVGSVAFMLQLGLGPRIVDGIVEWPNSYRWLSSELPYGPGGWLALEASETLVLKLGGIGSWVILGLLAVISFMLATEMAFYPAFVALNEWLAERREGKDEGWLTAVGGWSKRLLLGLWDFLRGADLEPVLAGGGRASKTAKTTRAKAKPKRAAKKKVEPTPLIDLAEQDEEEEEEEYDDDDDDDEYALDDDEEWEEEDEEEEDEGEYDYDDDEEWEDEEEYEDEEEPVEITPVAKPAAKKKAAAKKKVVAKNIGVERVFEPPTPPPGPWTLPPLDILEPPSKSASVEEDALETAARKLEHALKSFRVESEVVAAQVGPAVTMFELTIAQGTRMNKVTQLSQEIAATLKAKSVRIIAPIPGKATIGIEVPNKKRRVVRLSELVTQKAYDPKVIPLPLFLGMDAEGEAILGDMAKMPHLLIAGTTGSGKSVCINTILASLLLTRSPHDVKMILVDPKMVELQMFAKVPHLMLPVVTDARQATNVLLWAVEKMEGRYELFKDAGVKNIKGFNTLKEEDLKQRMGDNWNEERTPRHMPYIVVVIDEMADLMMVSKKEAEQAITRLAQKSRAVGIHVVVATQRPSTDVITGVLKGNLPTRIAFQVASKIDSRVILDASGAEKLLGGGDMLYAPPQSSQLKRVQGALVEDHELQSLVDFVCQESAPNFSQELVQTATGTAPADSSSTGGAEDPMFDDAVRVILKTKRGSASLLQRALGVGYTRASRLIDMMTEAGIVGEHKGSKAREILMTLEDWEEMNGTPQEAGAGSESEGTDES